MTLQAYIEKCKELFNADRYGWSTWEQEQAEEAYYEDRSPEDAVDEMNQRYVRRQADRYV